VARNSQVAILKSPWNSRVQDIKKKPALLRASF
jgi:hypothetical protein